MKILKTIGLGFNVSKPGTWANQSAHVKSEYNHGLIEYIAPSQTRDDGVDLEHRCYATSKAFYSYNPRRCDKNVSI